VSFTNGKASNIYKITACYNVLTHKKGLARNRTVESFWTKECFGKDTFFVL